MKLFSLLFWMLLLVSAQAQTAALQPDPGQRLLQQERLRQEEEQRQRAANQIQNQPQKQALPSEQREAGPKFYIETITLEGADHLDRGVLQKILAKYEKSEFTKGKLDRLLSELTNAYIDQGLITSRVYIPPQNIASKKLKLIAVEGHIGSITVNENQWPDQAKAFTAFSSESGDLLQLRDLEQGLDQMNRVPSGRATMQLQPGDKPGESNIAITNKPVGEYRFSAAYDNFGQTATGRDRLNLGLGLDNVFNLNESINAYYLGSKNSNALAGSFSVPYEWWTFNAGATYSEYLIGVQPGVDIFGDTYLLNTGLNRMLYRDARNKLTAGVTLDVKNSGRILNDVVLIPQPLTTITFDMNESYRADAALWNFDLAYVRGFPILGAANDPVALENDLPHREFDRFQGSVSLTQGLQSWLEFHSLCQGQFARQGQYGSEQLFLGDSYTVRGYRDSSAVGDDGVFTRNELEFNLPAVTKLPWIDWVTTKLQPYAFTDAGYVSLKSTPSGEHLWGAGLGLRFNWDYASADVSWARALATTPGLLKRDDEFYLSFTARVF